MSKKIEKYAAALELLKEKVEKVLSRFEDTDLSEEDAEDVQYLINDFVEDLFDAHFSR